MPMSNYIKNVAIVGAGGNVGSFMTRHLLDTGKHTVTAITRKDSTSVIPEAVNPTFVDYEDHASLVSALRGQDALIITIAFRAPKDLQERLIRAAADADVPWILPNEWAADTADEGLTKDISSLSAAPGARALIKELGKSSYLALTCGLWYEWCVSDPVFFAIDAVKKEATLFDGGDRKICLSTWPQIGRAVAALLSLPVKSESDTDRDRCLEHFRNDFVYIASFTVSQRDMLQSVCRVTGSKESEWKIQSTSRAERFNIGLEGRMAGDLQKGRLVYTRLFFDDDAGNHGKRKGLANELLGLPEEDIDESTMMAVENQKSRGE